MSRMKGALGSTRWSEPIWRGHRCRAKVVEGLEKGRVMLELGRVLGAVLCRIRGKGQGSFGIVLQKSG